MKILFYRYGSICESDILEQFQNLGLTIIEEKHEIENKNLLPSERVSLLTSHFKNNIFLFVFSINFFPSISDICEIYHIPYVCWSVDCPVLELFTPSVVNSCNHIFLFDHQQYNDVSWFVEKYTYGKNIVTRPHLSHLPLATNATRWNNAISTITEGDISHFSSDISFVGSLYTEKDPYLSIKNLSAYTQGYIKGIIDAQIRVVGNNILKESLSTEIIQDLIINAPDWYSFSEILTPSIHTEIIESMNRYITAHQILGIHASALNRHDIISSLTNEFSVSLYTRSDTKELRESSNTQNLRIYNGAKTFTEMPKIFALSKINLNMTIYPIQTGLSLRIWDIMGCGGFLLTNYQEELFDYLIPGEDFDYYTCKEELIEKCRFYLKNEDIRSAIAQNGCQKTKQYHSYEKRITTMFKHITQQDSFL